jgi:hypothetical protein
MAGTSPACGWAVIPLTLFPTRMRRPPIHHCIVQHVGSPRVPYVGQEESFDAALECGHHLLGELARPHPERANLIYEFADDPASI